MNVFSEYQKIALLEKRTFVPDGVRNSWFRNSEYLFCRGYPVASLTDDARSLEQILREDEESVLQCREDMLRTAAEMEHALQHLPDPAFLLRNPATGEVVGYRDRFVDLSHEEGGLLKGTLFGRETVFPLSAKELETNFFRFADYYEVGTDLCQQYLKYMRLHCRVFYDTLPLDILDNGVGLPVSGMLFEIRQNGDLYCNGICLGDVLRATLTHMDLRETLARELDGRDFATFLCDEFSATLKDETLPAERRELIEQLLHKLEQTTDQSEEYEGFPLC